MGKHNVRLLDLVSYGVGAMIGAGIFVLSGSVARIAGPAGIIAFLLAGLLALITAHSYVEFSKDVFGSGGGYTFISSYLPHLYALMGGAWLFFAYIAAGVFYAASFGFFFSLFTGIPWETSAFILAVSLTLLNALTFVGSVLFERLVVILKLTLLALFSIIGVLQINPANYAAAVPNGPISIVYSTALIFIAFEGFDVITTTGGEILNVKEIPKAIYISLAVVVAIYVLIMMIMTGVTSYENVPPGEHGFIAIATMLMGPIGRVFVIVSAVASALGAFNATMFAASRVAFAMAEDGRFPSPLKKRNRRGVPYVAVLLSGLIAISILIESMVIKGTITILGELSSLAFLLSFAMVNISLIVKYKIERKKKIVLPLMGAISCLLLTYFISLGSWVILATYTIFIVAYEYVKRGREALSTKP